MNLRLIIIFNYLLLGLPQPAHAYLDPGTGSVLFSLLMALLSGAYFMVRKIPDAISSINYRVQGGAKSSGRGHIVIYGESANYWATFHPLLEEFGRRGEKVEYLTSSENDPCFSASLPANITCRYIGTGNKAYTYLNFIKADVMVLTTPGVGTLQIRRSKGVRKYIHVLHSVGDIHYYKYFSFDDYDAVLCNGDYQVKSLRALEALRGTKAKNLPIAGCPYLDGLVGRKNSLGETTPDPDCILIAPTWGKLSMFNRSGSEVPRILAEAGFKVILRPHPQSYISDIDLMERMETELKGCDNITWDKNPDGFASLSKASLMISDFSSVIFDFAFVFLRPVITMLDENQSPDGFEAFDLDHIRWNTSVLNHLGPVLTTSDLSGLPELVRQTLAEKNNAERIRELRDADIANFGCAAKPVVDEILKIANTADK